MRPLLLLAAATAIADPYCDSRTTPPPARSLYGFTDEHHSTCLADLAGTWQTPGMSLHVWVLARSDSTESCGATALDVYWGDTTVARIVADTLELRWLDADSAARDSMLLDSSVAVRYRLDRGWLDTAFISDWSEEQGRITALRIDGVLFLDIAAAESRAHILGRGMAVPAHWIWRADRAGDSIFLRPLSEPWLRARIDSGRTIIGHENVDSGVVLTAPPAVLRRFLGRHLTDTLAFPDSGTIHLGRWHPDTAS